QASDGCSRLYRSLRRFCCSFSSAPNLCHTVTHDSVVPHYCLARSIHPSNAQTSLPGRFFVAAAPRGTGTVSPPHPASGNAHGRTQSVAGRFVKGRSMTTLDGSTGTPPHAGEVQVYDTTLRDGAQQEGMNLSVS